VTVLDGTQLTLPKSGPSPPIYAHAYCGQTAGWIKMTLGMEVGLGLDATWYGSRPQPRRLCVRWEPSSTSPKKDWSPQFSAHVYCGQTAGWIKMPVGTEVGLGPGDIVLDGDPAPPSPRGTAPPIFGQCPLWPNG